jgi:hypothetical protein
MNNATATPELADISGLGKQIELDRLASVHELRQRDHAIGLQCDAPDDVGRLLFWLQRVAGRAGPAEVAQTGWCPGVSAAILMRILAAVLGFMGMAGFLLAGERGLINVFVFLLLFVLIQLVFCLVSTGVMINSLRGGAPVVLPMNPAKFVVSRSLPDMRYLRESQSVVRVLLLRYGQEFGAIFTLGAVLAFFTVLGFSDFTFVWGSTFNISDEFVLRFTTLLASPWSSWLPGATLPAQVIVDSRYNPALTNLAQADVASMHAWWPFLIMAMLCYALLPRIILWGLSKWFYVKLMRRSFVEYPGSESILLRMKSPLVSTRALEPEETGHAEIPGMPLDDRLLLLAWAGALDTGDLHRFEELRRVPPANVLAAGLGTLEGDGLCIERIDARKPARLLVAVKAWEPPMADLRDFLDRLEQVTRCTLYLVPLSDRVVSDLQLQEWRDFSRELRFDAVDTQPLTRL